MITVGRTLALASFGLVAGSAPAFAHAHLKSATPPMNGSISAAPTELDLTFSEGINLRFTGAKLTGPDKKPVPTGDATLGAGGDTTLVVPVSGDLARGTYTVSWHALSADGHKTGGSYTFTIKP